MLRAIASKPPSAAASLPGTTATLHGIGVQVKAKLITPSTQAWTRDEKRRYYRPAFGLGGKNKGAEMYVSGASALMLMTEQ